MTDVLGYPRFVASGGDLGAIVTAALGALARATSSTAIQLEAVFGSTTLDDPTLADDERAFLQQRVEWARDEGAYAHQQGTRPRTLSFGLSDSPAGMLAWIARSTAPGRTAAATCTGRSPADELLVTPTLYWAGEQHRRVVSPVRRHRRDRRRLRRSRTSRCPSASPSTRAICPRPVRAYAERHFNVQRWTVMPRGGHFAPLEVPDCGLRRLRAFFASAR